MLAEKGADDKLSNNNNNSSSKYRKGRLKLKTARKAGAVPAEEAVVRVKVAVVSNNQCSKVAVRAKAAVVARDVVTSSSCSNNRCNSSHNSRRRPSSNSSSNNNVNAVNKAAVVRAKAVAAAEVAANVPAEHQLRLRVNDCSRGRVTPV